MKQVAILTEQEQKSWDWLRSEGYSKPNAWDVMCEQYPRLKEFCPPQAKKGA